MRTRRGTKRLTSGGRLLPSSLGCRFFAFCCPVLDSFLTRMKTVPVVLSRRHIFALCTLGARVVRLAH